MINGKLNSSQLSLIPGGRLCKPGALRWNLMCAACRAAGVSVPMPNGPDSSYRSFARQVYWKSWWTSKGHPENAAVPGTSNHGLGLAVDTNDRNAAYRYGGEFGIYAPSDAPWESWHTLIRLVPLAHRVPALEPELRKGVVNRAAVHRLQLRLAAQGLKVRATGAYDLQTRRAVRRFQKAHRLPVTGSVNKATWDTLTVALRKSKD